jgi:hypothetical protein
VRVKLGRAGDDRVDRRGSTLGIKTIPMPAHDAAEIETPMRVGSGGGNASPLSHQAEKPG